MSSLFSPFTLKGVTLRNRMVVSPMCQYSAVDGMPGDWHIPHYATLARGGAGLVVVEATAVSPEGRITHGDLGLWNDQQADAFKPITRLIKAAGAVPGIQIGHAGRKASAQRPWEGDKHIPEGDPLAWQTFAPSALPFGANLPRVPTAMTKDDIARVVQNFVSAAERASAAGFEWLLLHFAHGYLIQSFLSTHSNQRDDSYGGSLENRQRLLVEIVTAIRKVWPKNHPLTARFGVIEFDGKDEETLSQAIDTVSKLKAAGLDFIDVSVGFSTPTAQIPWAPNFLVDIAAKVRAKTGLPGSTGWLISDPELADAMIKNGQLDLIMFGRTMLENPLWPYAAAKRLNIQNPAEMLPPPYSHWAGRYR